MKSKDLQPRLLYPARLLFRIKGKIEFLKQEKVKGIPHHQTRITRILLKGIKAGAGSLKDKQNWSLFNQIHQGKKKEVPSK